MIYVILGPGRTGSNLLCQLISNDIASGPGGICNAIRTASDSINDVRHALNLSNIENVVIHSHNPHIVKDLNLNPINVTLILSKRKDLFEIIMSHVVTKLTNEWHDYTNKPVKPKVFPVWLFKRWYRGFKQWFDNVDLSPPFAQIITLYLEDYRDFDTNIEYLRNIFNVPTNLAIVNSPKCRSPYSYKKLVLNWNELYETFKELESVLTSTG